MRVKDLIISSLRPQNRLSSEGIVGKTTEINQRIEENIKMNEKKIAIGMKKAQGIQMK